MNQAQDQPLLLERNGSTPAYTDPGRSKPHESEELPDEESNPSAGFDDGFSNFSDSMQAFNNAIFHGVIYIVVGILFFSFILDTKFTVIDSMYFSTCVFTTVGYGDITPDSSVAGMIFTIMYSFYGIVILGIFLGILGDMAVERQQQLNKKISKYASTKYLDSLTKSIEENAEESDKAEDRPFIYEIIGILSGQRVFITVLIILATPMMYLENWSFVRGIYWVVITATTVGLGDEYPSHEVSKLICIFYVPIAVAFGGSFIGQIATAYVDKRNDELEGKFLGRALNESALEKMDSNQDNKVTKDEFLIYMLKTLDKVEQDDIEKICALFDKLDKDGSGSLTTEDIQFIPNQTAKLHYNESQSRSNKRGLLF